MDDDVYGYSFIGKQSCPTSAGVISIIGTVKDDYNIRDDKSYTVEYKLHNNHSQQTYIKDDLNISFVSSGCIKYDE